MAVFETWLRSDLKKPMRVVELSGNLFSADNGGNLIGVEVLDGGQAASLSGNVYGYVIRADGGTVLIDGTLSGNRASIVLPASAYVVIGQVSIVIKVGAVTVGACVAQVYRTTTDTIVDPANVIPSISELLEAIDDCEQATADANSAAELANTKAGLADDAATLANTKAGLADAAATAANTAAGTANTAAGKIDNMTVAANGLAPGSSPTVAISEVSGHKHILFGLVKGDKGKDFHIAKTFSSIADMMAYTGTDIETYDFAMIDTGSVEDPDTGKLYCYEPDKTPKWQYIGDLSGAQGIKGETGTGIDHITLNADYTLTIYLDDNTSYTTASIRGETGETPDISIGTVTTLNYDQQAYVTRDQSSTPEDPVFNFGIPRGEPGSVDNVYGTTVPMSTTDSTKVATAIGNKLNANQGSANAGKFMRVGSTGAVEYDYPTERYASLNDFPATGDEGKLYIAEDNGMIYVWDDEYVPVGGSSEEDCEASGSIVSFDAFETPVKELVIDIEPVQDLHGYDHPWPGGGGKNKLPFDLATMKSLNLGGSWTNNVYLRDGITITVNADGTIKASGQAEYNVYFTIYESQFVADSVSGTYILNGCPSGGSGSTYNIDIEGCSGSDSGSGVTLTYSGTLTKTKTRIRIISGANLGTGIVFKPMIRLATETDATFAPYENVCPISGWDSANVSRTGVNVWDEEWEGGSISPTTGANANDNTRIRAKNYISVLPSTAYYYKSNKDLALRYYGLDKSFIGTGSARNNAVTTPANCYFVRFAVVDTTEYANDISINYPSTDTQYHTYSGSTAEYEFPQEAGTVYGGSLTIHQDGTGELVVDRADVDLGSLSWGITSAGSFGTTVTGMKTGGDLSDNAICDYYPIVSNGYNGAHASEDKVLWQYTGTDGIRVMDSAYSTNEQIKTGLSGRYLCYTLATPVTYQLTNQQVIQLLEGRNVLWSDTGDILSLKYYRTKIAYHVDKNTEDIAELQDRVDENEEAISELQNDFTGATASEDGEHGLVPAPVEGDQGKFLKGDGTWGNVPNPQVMTGATASAAGAAGLVPAPAAGDQEKCLKGDGTWGRVSGWLLTPDEAFSIPSEGDSVTYTMAGITAAHQLVRWNFSSSAENNPPASLEWATAAGSFTITNNGGDTDETIQPVFAETIVAAIEEYTETEGE